MYLLVTPFPYTNSNSCIVEQSQHTYAIRWVLESLLYKRFLCINVGIRSLKEWDACDSFESRGVIQLEDFLIKVIFIEYEHGWCWWCTREIPDAGGENVFLPRNRVERNLLSISSSVIYKGSQTTIPFYQGISPKPSQQRNSN